MTQAEIFDQFMRNIWRDGACPQDGGEHADLEATEIFERANDVAETLGARPTSTNTGPDDDDQVEWLFPDGSTKNIARNGSGIS